jgi:DNA-binding MurR/RpiR family transcriptional regulator
MSQAPLAATLTAAFETMPPQLQAAARWVLDHPEDVALLSMREQARRAGVPPATLTRLAQRLGYDGYDSVRAIYAEAVRQRPETFHGRAEELLARREAEGDAALVMDTTAILADHLRRLAEPQSIERLTAAADRLAQASRVFCFGLRTSFPVAYVFHYLRSLFGASSVIADGAGGIGIDALRTIGPGDALLAVTVQPYTRHTVESVRFARSRGAAVVAITDSAVAPIATLADDLVIVGTATPSFLHTMAPAFAAAECLAALVAARKGADALAALEVSEAQLAAFDTYVLPTRKKRPAS